MNKNFYNNTEILLEAQSDETNIKFSVENDLNDIAGAELVVRHLDGSVTVYKVAGLEADGWVATDSDGEEVIEGNPTQKQLSALGLV
ncbi:hypothetical protein F0342_06825 [Bacillus sp. CH30_1T]|uniref:hypothetical protein n=1 Tax=Bacillus sp. CH30_1T TaxID=2604836 RepID=UPI0011ECFB7C|nr:hypothetical protein [Bacillus sp. CH30_1T]KAA0565317.1 hypothetical protein F0342_06825 [Bacillus sp. CH30_1T]